MKKSFFSHKPHSFFKKPKKSIFGGEILNNEQIQQLSKKINDHEEKELELFEKEFEKKADEIWSK